MNQEEKSKQAEISNPEETNNPEEKKSSQVKNKKLKSALTKIGVFLLLLVLSIGTSSMNLVQEGENFLKNIFMGISGMSSEETEYTDVSSVVKGKNVQIKADEIYNTRLIFEILDEDNSAEYAIEVLKKVKTLAYYAEKAGYVASSSDIDAYIEDLTDKLKEANEFKYDTMVQKYGSEKNYWKQMRDSVKEKLLEERLLKEKREEFLQRDQNADAESKLEEYVKERIAEENFKNLTED